MIKKKNKDLRQVQACEWLKENNDHPFIGCEDPCLSGYLTDEFIDEFKKAMKEWNTLDWKIKLQWK